MQTRRGDTMRLLKSYLALDHKGHFVTASEVLSPPEKPLSCTSCGCTLIHHPAIPPLQAWFEHDLQDAALEVLMRCVHQDPAIKAEARARAMRRMINGLEDIVPVLSWHCVMCRGDYCGEKCCTTCGTGIFSIEKPHDRPG